MTFTEYLKIIWMSWGAILVLIFLGIIALGLDEWRDSQKREGGKNERDPQA